MDLTDRTASDVSEEVILFRLLYQGRVGLWVREPMHDLQCVSIHLGPQSAFRKNGFNSIHVSCYSIFSVFPSVTRIQQAPSENRAVPELSNRVHYSVNLESLWLWK